MFLLFSSSAVAMWSQGSSAVLNSWSCNFFQFFSNFQVLFKWCSCYSPQVVRSCDLRVQMLCSSDVPVIYFNFSLIFKSCSCDVLAICLKWCDHVISGFKWCSCNSFRFFLNFLVLFKWCYCSFLQVMWSCDLRVQMVYSSHVPVIYFKFSPFFKCCSSDVLSLFFKCSGHVISGFKWPVQKMFIYFSLIFLIFICSSNSHFNLVTVDIAHVVMWCDNPRSVFSIGRWSSFCIIWICDLSHLCLLVGAAFLYGRSFCLSSFPKK